MMKLSFFYVSSFAPSPAGPGSRVETALVHSVKRIHQSAYAKSQTVSVLQRGARLSLVTACG